jgi:translation initiation factor 2B subunit (eIF-2B alpha/beta/delta family)
VDADLVADAALTTYLPRATAVIVGADAVAARHWTNKAGTYGLAAAAWFSGVGVYVLASRDKAESEALTPLIELPRTFERIPVQLGTQFLTDAGPATPDALGGLAERCAPDLAHLFRIL